MYKVISTDTAFHQTLFLGIQKMSMDIADTAKCQITITCVPVVFHN